MDYVGVHWYGGTDAAHFKTKMRRIYEKYGRRPLLITEFAPADWQAKTHSQNRMKAPDVLAFMKEVLPWLEKQIGFPDMPGFLLNPMNLTVTLPLCSNRMEIYPHWAVFTKVLQPKILTEIN